jgi:molybdopterin-guanine dinucleotide biosynthesis protein A
VTTEPLYGLLLAGGKSRRMGRDKALLMCDGRSQLDRMGELLGHCVERVFVSVRPEQQDEPERRRFEQVVDRYDDLGPVAGILSAMDDHPQADWLVVACDLPNISEDTLRTLLAGRSTAHPFTAYTSTYDGLPEPLCAVYTASSHAIVRRFVADGIACPRKILIRSETMLLQQPDPAALDNINTPNDLESSVLREAR